MDIKYRVIENKIVNSEYSTNTVYCQIYHKIYLVQQQKSFLGIKWWKNLTSFYTENDAELYIKQLQIL